MRTSETVQQSVQSIFARPPGTAVATDGVRADTARPLTALLRLVSGIMAFPLNSITRAPLRPVTP